MFNLFKSKETQEVSKQVLTDKKYSSDIEQIHHEFSIAGDELLREAELILATCVVNNVGKADMLRSLGFNSVPEVKDAMQKEQTIKISQQTADLIKYYKEKYPFNRFINEESVERICKKYNLVCGDVGLYKGFVPETNLKQIAKFSLKEEDKPEWYIINEGVEHLSSWTPVKLDSSDFTPSYENYISSVGNHWTQHALVNDIYPQFTRIACAKLPSNSALGSFKICAPIKDMDTAGMRLNGYKLEKHIPDPIVLQPVVGGYLIVTAWGDEASDEDVINSTNN